jgi:DNA ligase-1
MTPDLEFKQLRIMSKEISATSSATEKQTILAKYPDMKQILLYTYHPLMKYNITSKNVIKRKPDFLQSRRAAITTRSPYTSIYALLESLHIRKITGTEALDSVLQFIEQYPDYETEIFNIIDKDLKIRIDASTINKVFKKLIPTFDVALANDYWKVVDRVDFEKDTWFASRKIDGVRCIIIEEGGEPAFYSRQGRKFDTLGVLAKAIKQIPDWDSFVFDGEVCLVDAKGDEDFASVMKEIRKKDHDIASPRLKVFDILSKKEFIDGRGKAKFVDRVELLQRMKTLAEKLNIANFFDVIDQIKIKDQQHLMELAAKATSNGWEGLILRKNVPYAGKRSNDMLKVKNFHDAEYEVTGMDTGPFRYIVNGQETTEEMLTAVHIEHKGYKVSVGSGFTIDQRKYYFANPSEIIGSTIKVKYFQETTNAKGTISLRFPTIQFTYGTDGRWD